MNNDYVEDFLEAFETKNKVDLNIDFFNSELAIKRINDYINSIEDETKGKLTLSSIHSNALITYTSDITTSD